MTRIHQKLPGSGPEREALRGKGQFWTPAWVAEAMVAYVTLAGSKEIFDPAVGAGAFFLAARGLDRELGRALRFRGSELDPSVLDQALAAGLRESDLKEVQVTDFVLRPPSGPLPAIVANPPYLRHHRLSARTKDALRRFCVGLIGHPLDGRTGYHVYFLLRALQLLEQGGRLAFIMPADTCEGVFAAPLWRWITSHFCLDAVITFSPDATPFPRVDTNAVVFLIRKTAPEEHIHWVHCKVPDTAALKEWVLGEAGAHERADLEVHHRALSEALTTGLSRPPSHHPHTGPRLGSVAAVCRGIATGANEFFFMTRRRARELKIPQRYFVTAIGRTRDITGDVLTAEQVVALEATGRPTQLLSIGDEPLDRLPSSLRDYLRMGEEAGYSRRALISTRRPWYRMEVRRVPPILFAYLGRRNARFILNEAGVVPLTGFLCVYPRRTDPDSLRRLWGALSNPEIPESLRLVGKSYGSGAIKAEPRALENLPLSHAVLGGEPGRPETDLAVQGEMFQEAKQQ